MSLGIRGVLQENYEQIDAHENHNRPEVMKDDEGTSKESDQEITTNNIDNLEEKSDEENNDQETGDEIKTEDDDGKFKVFFSSLTSTTLLILKNFNTFTSYPISASNVINISDFTPRKIK